MQTIRLLVLKVLKKMEDIRQYSIHTEVTCFPVELKQYSRLRAMIVAQHAGVWFCNILQGYCRTVAATVSALRQIM